MKGTIAKLILRALIVGIALFAFVPLASAHSLTSQVQTQPRIPAGQCLGDNCDGVKPPPLSNCSNDITLNTKTIYDANLAAIGDLNLFADESNCLSLWAGLKDDLNPQGKCFDITSLEIIETNSDRSIQQALDGYPWGMCRPGQWESSFMVGIGSATGSYTFYAHSVVTDELGNKNDTTNTATATCSVPARGQVRCTI